MKKYIVYNCICRPAGGLADRIKGLVSCYALAKATKRDFIINWTYPYDISEILEPNKVNWKRRKIVGTAEEHFIFDCEGHDQYRPIFNSPDINDHFNSDIVCIKTNLNFTEHFPYSFESLFEELFCLRASLPFNIESDTIGLCARFGGKQCNWGDINFGRELSFDFVVEKAKQISADKKIFLCTDSQAFYDYAKDRFNFMHVPGTTEHMDREGCSLYGFKKSFIDFYLLRECDTIISTKGEFAKTAALSKGKLPVSI
ncbi:MAG: hypothetical protein EBU90_03445 [Proteobacteria bacterium]|nr:hypothetical protein [Pseudomonadota bacterium]NBP13382.1 hypothetical protein [bacterium]